MSVTIEHKRQLLGLASQLSPENLTCDGELSPTQDQRRLEPEVCAVDPKTYGNEVVCLFGWIVGKSQDRQKLQDMGITVGEVFDEASCMFTDCIVPETAMAYLEPLWMKEHVWGLGKEVCFPLKAHPEDLDDDQLLAARAYWQGKINGPENDGRLTAHSSASLDHWMDLVEEIDEVVARRSASSEYAAPR
jgi:hypothetical protein